MKTILHLPSSILAAFLAALTQLSTRLPLRFGERAGVRCVPLLSILILLSTFSPQPCLAQTNCAPRPSGLVGWWTGDGTTLDLAGTNHAALQSGGIYAPGQVGPAFRFNG